MDNEHVLRIIRELAHQVPHVEIGGTIVRRGKVLALQIITNIACDTRSAYIPHPGEFIDAQELGDLVGIWHTHVNGNPNFSPNDIAGIWTHDVPWTLYDLQNDRFNYFDPNLDKLLGREWVLGLTDCWAIARDFYRFKLNRLLPPPEPPPQKWSNPNWNRALERLPQAFTRVWNGKIEQYDLLLYHSFYPGANPAHVGVILDGKDDTQILHHPYKQLSQLTPLPPAEKIHSIWRLKCPPSNSNCSEYWDAVSGQAIESGHPDLAKHYRTLDITIQSSSVPY